MFSVFHKHKKLKPLSCQINTGCLTLMGTKNPIKFNSHLSSLGRIHRQTNLGICSSPAEGTLQRVVKRKLPKNCAQLRSLIRVYWNLTQRGRGKQVMINTIHILRNTLREKTKQWVKTTGHQYLSNLSNRLYCTIKPRLLMPMRYIWRYCFSRISEELLTYSCCRAQTKVRVHCRYERFHFKIAFKQNPTN